MMSNGPPPARPNGTVDDARWLFPQERAPPPRDEGCKNNGFGDPAHHASNGSPPTPSPPSKSSPPSIVSTSFPTLVTMRGIAPADACSPPAILTEWRLHTSHEGLDGTFMVNFCSGKRLWQPPASDWDYASWDIEPIPNPTGTWYRVPGSRRWVLFDVITSWIHRPTAHRWFLAEDTAQPIACARPPLPIQAHLASDDPQHKGECCKAGCIGALHQSHPPSPYVLCGCNIVNVRGGLPAIAARPSVDNGEQVGRQHAPSDGSPTQTASSPPWLTQRTLGAQSAKQGHSLPPTTNDGGGLQC